MVSICGSTRGQSVFRLALAAIVVTLILFLGFRISAFARSERPRPLLCAASHRLRLVSLSRRADGAVSAVGPVSAARTAQQLGRQRSDRKLLLSRMTGSGADT